MQSKVAKVTGKAQAKAMASSLSDFSSEDDQPLVKKNKPLMQARKLLKKSIASIGRKLKLEPRRSRRGMPLPAVSQATRQKTYGILCITSYYALSFRSGYSHAYVNARET